MSNRWFVSWSRKANRLFVEAEESALAANYIVFIRDSPSDYIPLMVCNSCKEAKAVARALSAVLLDNARRSGRTVLVGGK